MLTDRDEEEVRGYRQALNMVHEAPQQLVVSEATIKRLQAACRPGSSDAGEYKSRDTDIVELDASGTSRVRFRTVPAAVTPTAMADLVSEWAAWRHGRWVAPLVAVAAFNLDFLCVHPFRDGNGRTSRLLWLLQCHQLGYDVGRYISFERIIEENKEKMHAMAKALLEWETIDGDQLDDIIAGKEPRPPKDWTPRNPSVGPAGNTGGPSGGTPVTNPDPTPAAAKVDV